MPGKRCLPTPAEVAARSKQFGNHPRPRPVRFDDLNLVVKFGPLVRVEEAICLRMIGAALSGKVPVPEVYGWRVDGRYVFIYMELVQGETLHDRWDSLSNGDRTVICNQLPEIISPLRDVAQEPTNRFIGSITGQSCNDHIFKDMPQGGPFNTTKEFSDWFASLPQH
ncbi:hypothetical protein AJ80_01828 [Polytolypa hystricis UAMH7299]|uniref:Aminoglycoside phosphotransferase domain-containing protein n=1 Tax=Polytolypa hystricis (strain UAMH7299) TaxID=1447883 RepID=A0A2B7YR72_POLH7|nr:hypothetical protein AJ80_01828 [Polytolypa hystricis UAMH7299]